MRREHLARDAGIGPAGDFDMLQIVVNFEAVAKATPQGALPGATGSHQGSINIEEEKFLVQAVTLPRRSATEPRAKIPPDPGALGGRRGSPDRCTRARGTEPC